MTRITFSHGTTMYRIHVNSDNDYAIQMIDTQTKKIEYNVTASTPEEAQRKIERHFTRCQYKGCGAVVENPSQGAVCNRCEPFLLAEAMGADTGTARDEVEDLEQLWKMS